MIWPLLIFWSLGAIVFGDPGRVDAKLKNNIYSANNINVFDIGTKYSMQQVLLTLTENYFISQGFLNKSSQ